MSLSCDFDTDGGYIEVEEELLTSVTPFKCFECRKEIPAGSPFHMVRNWRIGTIDDDPQDWKEGDETLEGEEIDISNRPCCEVCADLGSSVLELGYCWEYGQLRNDIAEMNEMS